MFVLDDGILNNIVGGALTTPNGNYVAMNGMMMMELVEVLATHHPLLDFNYVDMSATLKTPSGRSTVSISPPL